jgi:hypothetical protein
MADDGEPVEILTRPRPRRWFISPGEPRDYKTFQTLCEAAMTEAREGLLTNPRASQLLALIGRRGKEGHTIALQGEVGALILKRLATPQNRQAIKGAWLVYHCVPLPKAGRLEGVVIIKAWRHTLRSLFDVTIGK